jgi:hypothetical protein
MTRGVIKGQKIIVWLKACLITINHGDLKPNKEIYMLFKLSYIHPTHKIQTFMKENG